MTIIDLVDVVGPVIEIIQLLAKHLGRPSKKNQVIIEMILVELFNNYCQIAEGCGNNCPIHEVINTLKYRDLETGIRQWMNLGHFPKKPIQVDQLFEKPSSFYERYDGWSPKKLILNIYQKTVNLKTIVENYSDLSRFNLRLRLRNLGNLIVLLFLYLQQQYDEDLPKKGRSKKKKGNKSHKLPA